MLATLRARYTEIIANIELEKEELASLQTTIEALSALCSEAPNIRQLDEVPAAGRILMESWLKHMPFADAIRTGLRIVAPSAFTTSELKELLARAGYPIHLRTEPMVALNVALKRMLEAGEVEVVDKDGRNAYMWAFKNELPPPPGSKPNIDWTEFLDVPHHGRRIRPALDVPLDPDKFPDEVPPFVRKPRG